jgi:TonB family protein
MWRRVLLAAACLAASAGVATAGPTDQLAPSRDNRPDAALPVEGVITDPDWLQRPTGDEMANYYPPVAQLLGLGGHVTMECEVTAIGATINCHIDGEAPLGMGFGDAALALAKYFRMKPMTLDGLPVAGGRVIVPISFRYPDDDDADVAPTPPTGPPPPAKSVELALQIVTATASPEREQAMIQQTRDALNQQLAEVSLTEQEQAAIDDYIAATTAALGAQRDTEAERYARHFTEDQLTQIAAFFASPAGHAWLADSASQLGQQLNRGEATQRAVRDDAHNRFCARVGCSDRRPIAPAPPKQPAAQPPAG